MEPEGPRVGLGTLGVADEMGTGMIPPNVLSKVDPGYTESARARRVEGKVTLTGVIATNGRATKLRVQRPLDPGLDAKAMEAVSQWVFSPGTEDDQPVQVNATFEIRFRLP